jgi:hypothetical protein
MYFKEQGSGLSQCAVLGRADKQFAQHRKQAGGAGAARL